MTGIVKVTITKFKNAWNYKYCQQKDTEIIESEFQSAPTTIALTRQDICTLCCASLKYKSLSSKRMACLVWNRNSLRWHSETTSICSKKKSLLLFSLPSSQTQHTAMHQIVPHESKQHMSLLMIVPVLASLHLSTIYPCVLSI